MDWLKEMYEEHGVVLCIVDLLAVYSGKLQDGRETPDKLEEALSLATVFTEQCHHGKEERALFPLLARQAGEVVESLLHDHAEGKKLVEQIRNGTNEDKISAIKAYETLLKAHIAKENRFFRDSDRSLSSADKELLAAGFARIDSEVLGNSSRRDYLERIKILKSEIQSV